MKAKKVLICFLIIFSLIIMSVGGIFLIQHLTTKTETNADLGEDKTEQENIEENTAEAKANTLYTLWKRTDEELFTFKAYMNSDYVISVSTSSTGDADSTTCTITVWPGVYFSSFSIDSWSGSVPNSKSANCSKKSYGANTITLTLSASWSWGWLQSGGDFTLTSTITLGIHGSLSSYASLSLSSTSYVYDGSEKKPTPTITYASSSSHAYGSFKMPSSSCSYTNNINAGTATCTVTNPSRYSGTLSATFTISKASNSWETTPSISNWTYGSSASTPKGQATYSGTVTFYYKKSTASSYTTTKPSAAGTYNFYCKDSGDSNHESIESSPITFNINYASNSWSTTPSISSWTYGDTASTPQGQARYSGSVTFYYKTSSASSWTTTKPSTPGTYNFYCYDSGASYYDSISSSSITFYIYVPNPTLATQSYTWTGSQIDISSISGNISYNSTYIGSPAGVTGTNVKSYNLVFTTKDTSYVFSNGTQQYTITWNIVKRKLTIPTVSGNFVYDGTSKQASISNYSDAAYISETGIKTAINANVYHIYFDLVDSSNTEWSNGTITQKSGGWRIIKNNSAIKPSLGDSGIYQYDDGNEIEANITGCNLAKVTRSGVYKQTDVGNYRATYTPNSNYVWSYSDESQVMGVLGGITYTKVNSEQAYVGVVWCRSTGGQYTGFMLVGLTPTSVEYYNSALGSGRIFTYAGTYNYNGVTYYYSSIDNLVEGMLPGESGGYNRYKIAGNYTSTSISIAVNAFLQSIHTTDVSAYDIVMESSVAKNIDWEITKKELEKPSVTGTYDYNGQNKTVQLNNFLNSYMEQSGEITEKNVNRQRDYEVTISLKDKARYKWKNTNSSDDFILYWNITPKDISEFSVEFDQSSFVYDGNTHTPNETARGDL